MKKSDEALALTLASKILGRHMQFCPIATIENGLVPCGGKCDAERCAEVWEKVLLERAKVLNEKEEIKEAT